MTCVFDPELQGILLEGSAHSCKLAPCDPSTLIPSTVSHDCPNSLRESLAPPMAHMAMQRFQGPRLPLLTGSSNGALVSDPTLPYPTCEALTCFIGVLLLNSSLFGPGCACCTMGESLRGDLRGRVPGSERNQWHFDIYVR